MVDDEYENNAGDVIENRLIWPSVSRKDLDAIFTCQAVNTNLTAPKKSTVLLDLHCKLKWKNRKWDLIFLYVSSATVNSENSQHGKSTGSW